MLARSCRWWAGAPHVLWAVGFHRQIATLPDFTSADPFRVLGLPNTASAEEVKRQYFLLAKLHHPDVTGGEGTVFQVVQVAYQKACERLSIPAAAVDPQKDFGSFRGAAKSPSASRGRAAPPRRQPERLQFAQLSEWWILSAAGRAPQDTALFQQWFQGWALLAAFEAAVDAATRGDDDAKLFFCDDAERAFWLAELDKLWVRWDAAWQQAQRWGEARAETLATSRQQMTAQQVVDQRKRLDSLLASLAKEAEEQFETVKLELMTKRAEAQAKTDGW
eukprot:EG_transcript_17771